MAYQLGDGETAERALRRSAREELDRAIAELTDGVKEDPVTAVHDARKALKKERSLLRLARGTLSSSQRRATNATLRDAGRRLSDARDAEVKIQAVDDLSSRYAGQLPKPAFDAVKAHLEAKAAVDRASPGAAREVAEQLVAVRSEIDDWRMRRDGWAAIGKGLERSYERGRRAFRRAQREPTTENLHEWRKRAKDLWYHVRLLEPVSPGVMHGSAQEAHQLSDLLGDDHDLAVLRESLAGDGAAVATDLDSMLALIDHRRRQLQADALHAGARLYEEKPKAFVRRIRGYWKVWQADRPAEEPVQLRGRVAATTGAG